MYKLKIERIRRGLAQRDVAQQLEISPSQLSLVESGKRALKPAVAKKLADILGLSLEEVLFPEEGAESH